MAFGVEFGTGFGDRLAWLDESAGILRRLLDDERVTSPEGGRYSLRDARLRPLPVQDHLPILIGGGGERKTLRTVARFADIWVWVGHEHFDLMHRKHAALDQRCEEIGRDPGETVRSAILSPVVRDTEAEALRFFEKQMEANRLDRSVLDDSDTYVTTVDRMTELMIEWKRIGVTNFIIETAAPFDGETAERFATEIRPAVESA